MLLVLINLITYHEIMCSGLFLRWMKTEHPLSEQTQTNNLLYCVQVLVKAGDKVAVGDPLMVMIAMKMEVRAPCWLCLTRILTFKLFESRAHTLTDEFDLLSVFVSCSTQSEHPSLVWSRRFSSARALRPIDMPL